MIQSEAILDYDDIIFFEEFIGNGDTDLSGQPLKRGEDRLFSTSMVINFYIATWTTQNKATGKLDWAVETPDYVKKIVDGAAEGLNRFILKNTYKTYGEFFPAQSKEMG
ncbi:uncharacterized protein [Antedon mediterranea]|uniref:uncharacterized protein n=1 Tax=Antedon mediterranea TaxID=105859 RepID=UPI003AF68EC5